MQEEYPWYKIISDSETLMQGDFLWNCPVIAPSEEISESVEVTVKCYNVIVMSQSCDLQHAKLDLVLVCPFWLLREVGAQNSFYKGAKGKEALRRGNIPGYHLLNKCSLKHFNSNDYWVVDFRNVFGVHYNFLFHLVTKEKTRLRLLSPYREHLSQAFARFFMRVGLPVDIPPFK